MGHEGQGVGPALADTASISVRIAQPGGEESLNVAAAAAICLHASALLSAQAVAETAREAEAASGTVSPRSVQGFPRYNRRLSRINRTLKPPS